MTGGQPRYGLRWRWHDLAATVVFTIRCRTMRYLGWGCLFLAAVMLALIPVNGALCAGTAIAALAVGGALMLADDVTFRRRTAVRCGEDDEDSDIL